MNMYKSLAYGLFAVVLSTVFSLTLASDSYASPAEDFSFSEQLADYFSKNWIHDNSSIHEYQIALVVAGTRDLEFRLEHSTWHDLDKYIVVNGVRVTLLGAAVCMGKLDTIKKILNKSKIAPEHFLNSEDRNLLHFIIRNQRLLSINQAIIPLLVRYGADVNHVENNTTPLQNALTYHRSLTRSLSSLNRTYALNIIRTLIVTGARGAINTDVGAELIAQPSKCTLRLLAALAPQETIRQRLSSNTRIAEINSLGDEGFSALHLAVARGDQDIVNLLLENGADIVQPAANGWTAFEAAVRHKHTHLVKLLLSHARKHKIIVKDFARFARITIRQNDLATLKLLLNELPSNIDCPAFNQLFEDVLLNGSLEVVNIFIAQINASAYRSPLILRGVYLLRTELSNPNLTAIQRDHYNNVLALLENGTALVPFMRAITNAVHTHFAVPDVTVNRLLPTRLLLIIASYIIGREFEMAKKK